jgi:hypothetical protein
MARFAAVLSLVGLALLLQPITSPAENPANAPTSSTSTSAPVSPQELSDLQKILGDLDPNDRQWDEKIQAQKKAERQSARDLLLRLSNAQLREVIGHISVARITRPVGADYALTEIISRGGKYWEVALGMSLRDTAAAHERAVKSGEWVFGIRNLELLTALRRVQGKTDPLLIVLAGKDDRRIKLDESLVLPVCLTNVDVERAPVGIQVGGDYRSGRQARWRIQVRDAKGNLLSERPFLGGMGGGISGSDILAYGESWATRLELSSFVWIEQPGEYTAEILYHDEYTIADYGSIEGLILSKSAPFKISVRPVTVQLHAKDREDITRWIGNLLDKGPVKIVAGIYGEWAHDFVVPQTPAGKLLASGWDAVPDLISAAVAEETPATRRAWILAILFSLTGRNDPSAEPGVIGPYQSRSADWVVRGGYDEGAGVMGLGSGSTKAAEGTIDPKKQLEFAARWKVWLDKGYIKIETPKDSPAPGTMPSAPATAPGV